GRSTLDTALLELEGKARQMADRLEEHDSATTSLALSRLREQFGVQEVVLFSSSGRVIAAASSSYERLVPRLPSAAMQQQLRAAGQYAAIEDATLDDESRTGPASLAPTANDAHLYRLRVIVAL